MEKNKMFQMRVDDEFLHAIDEWRSQQRPIPPRAEALRRLVDKSLEAAKAEGRTDNGENRHLPSLSELAALPENGGGDRSGN
ncbi:MAG: hypothetical protein F8N37_12000 [Telmatospirillum sp.]|nr:hypothetical protein [Telmatospirillum sp.]